MRRHLRQGFSVLAALVLLTMLFAAPVSAAPPERVEVDDFFLIVLDQEHEQVIFWNITREGFCAWEASGFEGPPPVLESVSGQFVETGKGAVVQLLKGSAPLELWRLDEDADLSGPCQDTDAQSAPWAVGTARAVRNDNDLDVTGTRTNAFGERLIGTASDAEGAVWHFSGHFRALITRDGEFRFLNENFTLAPGG
jgi:hypothetical protein